MVLESRWFSPIFKYKCRCWCGIKNLNATQKLYLPEREWRLVEPWRSYSRFLLDSNYYCSVRSCWPLGHLNLPFTVHLCINWTNRWEWSVFYTTKGDFHPIWLASAAESLSLRPPTQCWTIGGKIRGFNRNIRIRIWHRPQQNKTSKSIKKLIKKLIFFYLSLSV